MLARRVIAMKRISALGLVFILSLLFCVCAYADEILPFADSTFTSTSASLTTKKAVSFFLQTKETQQSIKITSCWLQKKDGNIWRFAKPLEVPSKTATNTTSYTAYMDYSSSIGSGTYRLGHIANADGHKFTRYSNERT